METNQTIQVLCALLSFAFGFIFLSGPLRRLEDFMADAAGKASGDGRKMAVHVGKAVKEWLLERFNEALKLLLRSLVRLQLAVEKLVLKTERETGTKQCAKHDANKVDDGR